MDDLTKLMGLSHGGNAEYYDSIDELERMYKTGMLSMCADRIGFLMEDRARELFETATEDDRLLYEKVISFSDLFEDMLFVEGSASAKLLAHKGIDPLSGEMSSAVLNRPNILESFTYTFFSYKVENGDPKHGGDYNPKDQTLCIQKNHLEYDDVILHEMIHMHEHVVDSLPLIWHDALYYSLYKSLKRKIRKLDKIISMREQMLWENYAYPKGGSHDILFMLKSFDLDLRLGYKLGTVHSYGLDELIEKKIYGT